MSNVTRCAVRLERTGHEMIIQPRRMYHETPEYSLQLEPDSFSRDLTEDMEQVCTNCWETSVDHQWRPRDDGGELVIEVTGNDVRSQYLTTDIQADRDNIRDPVLRLTSQDSLITEIPHKRIDSTSVTLTREVMY